MKLRDEALGGAEGVQRIGLGTLHLTVERGFGAARPGAVQLLHEAVELGVRFFDTADSYGPETAEEVIRQALHPYEGLVVATKGGFLHPAVDRWVKDGRPEHLRAAVDGSLQRLDLESLPLYQLHAPDPQVPYAESVGALRRLQDEGKIQTIGVSNVDLQQLETALAEAAIVSVQNPYSLDYQEHTDVLDYCEDHEIAFVPWRPLGDRQIDWHEPVLRAVAEKHEATAPQVVLSALLHRSPAMLPIPGTSSVEHLRQNVAAGRLRLDQEDLSRLWPDWREAELRRLDQDIEKAQAALAEQAEESRQELREMVFGEANAELRRLDDALSEATRLKSEFRACPDASLAWRLHLQWQEALERVEHQRARFRQAVERSRAETEKIERDVAALLDRSALESNGNE